MAEKRLMTMDEKFAVLMKVDEQLKAGNKTEAVRMTLELPMPTYIAKVVKQYLGADFLVKGGYNLAEVEAEFGPDWLTCETR
ncbi:MAG: hypothetical protein LBT00_01910 [Spirochaetaceae bacterium]|jgi:hypothetical protein|nr:hypothetical protein [Spirochaetaceae bacterium]